MLLNLEKNFTIIHIGNFNDVYKKHSLGVPKNAIKIIETFKKENADILISGGFVRDIILNKSPKDIDFVTNLNYEKIENLIKNNFFNIKHIDAQGKTFQVIRVLFDNGEEYEIATYRKDGTYSDGIHPDRVKVLSSPEQDAKRRDFTINALFYDPIKGDVIDYVGGLKDLKDRKLKFVGDPKKRIKEDKSRMLRYVRFLLTTGFDYDEKARIDIKQYARFISVVPKELVKKELDKMIVLDNGNKIIELLDEFGLLKFIFPELKELENCEQGAPYHMEGNALVHTKMVCSYLENPANPILKWSAIFHDIGKPEAQKENLKKGNNTLSFVGHAEIGEGKVKKILRNLIFKKNDISSISYVIRNHRKIAEIIDLVKKDKKKNIVKFIKKYLRLYGRENVINLVNLCIADYFGSIAVFKEDKEKHKKIIIECLNISLHEFEEELKKGINLKELVNGNLIMNFLNIKAGPEIRAIKNQILNILSDETFDSKSQLEKRLRELLKNNKLIK